MISMLPPKHNIVGPYDIFELEQYIQRSKGRQQRNDAFEECIRSAVAATQRPGWWRPLKRLWYDHYKEWAVKFAGVGIVYRTIECTTKIGVPREEIIAVVALLYPEFSE